MDRYLNCLERHFLLHEVKMTSSRIREIIKIIHQARPIMSSLEQILDFDSRYLINFRRIRQAFITIGKILITNNLTHLVIYDVSLPMSPRPTSSVPSSQHSTLGYFMIPDTHWHEHSHRYDSISVLINARDAGEGMIIYSNNWRNIWITWREL